MSYRLPRFSYRHTFREIGDSGFSASSTAFDASTPRGRLLDNQARQLAGPTTDVNHTTWFHRAGTAVTATLPYRLNRVLIPATHNFVADREVRIRTNDDGDELTFLTPARVDGATHTRLVPSSGLIDWEFADADVLTAEMLELIVYASGGSTIGRWGEVWWTQTVQPVEGEVPEWDDFIVPTQERYSLRSGASYINDTGQDLRAFTLSHIVDGGSFDDRLYDDLTRRNAGAPFWYEHPDSGGAVKVLDSLATLGGVTADAEIDLSVISGGAPDGVADCIQAQENAGTQPNGDVFVAFTSTDARNSILQFDVKIMTSAAWLNAATDFELFAKHDLAGNNISAYSIGAGLITNKPVDEWVRVQIDLENDVKAGGGGLWTTLDPSQLVLVFFRIAFDTIGQQVRFANLELIDKRKQPVLVEIQSSRRRQVRNIPVNGAIYRYDLDLIEVSS